MTATTTARERHVETLQPVLDRLTRIGTTDHLVVSCYLKLEPRDRARGKYLIKLKNRIKNRLAALDERGADRDTRRAVEADMERIRAHLDDPEELPAGRGIALFACGPLDLFEVVPLPRVFRSRLAVDHSPLVRELAAVGDEFGRVLCVAYDRTSARFFEVTAGDVVEHESLAATDASRSTSFHRTSESERHKSPRGAAGRGVGPSALGEHNFNMRIREEKQRHYAAIAERVFRATRRTSVSGIVLAGTGKDVDAVRPHLHPYVADAVLGTVKVNPKDASPAEVMDAVLELRRERERDWERRHVDALAEGLGTGWAVNGIEATLAALARGQVRTLLVDAEAEAPGGRCDDSGRLVARLDDCGPEGGGTAVPDVVDEAIEDALRQGSHVDVIEDDEARGQVDGLAALLRFTLS